MFVKWIKQEKSETASMLEMKPIKAIKPYVSKGLRIITMPAIATVEVHNKERKK